MAARPLTQVFDLELDKLSAMLAMAMDPTLVFLKQFRDVECPTKACYQAIVEARLDVDIALADANAFQLLEPAGFAVTVKSFASHPIEDELGIGATPVCTAAFLASLNFKIQTGFEVWRAAGLRRQHDDDEASHRDPRRRSGAITAAYYLSSDPDRYDITVYQQGWRLGGKGASGRGRLERIEEHGLHIWFGFYENAFRMLHECHEQLDVCAAKGIPRLGSELHVGGGELPEMQHRCRDRSRWV